MKKLVEYFWEEILRANYDHYYFFLFYFILLRMKSWALLGVISLIFEKIYSLILIII